MDWKNLNLLLWRFLSPADPLVPAAILTGDRDAITLVIDAIEHAPQDKAAKRLAGNLIDSDDPRAQSVLHQYSPDVNFQEGTSFSSTKRTMASSDFDQQVVEF